VAEPPDWGNGPKPPWWDDIAWWDVLEVPKPHWWDELAAHIAADPDWYVKYATAEAARGNPYPLIGLVHGYPISDAEVAAIRKALQTTTGKQTKRNLRDLEKKLIAIAVDRMFDEDGLTRKAASAKVSQGRKRSISHVKAAVTAHGKRRNYRA
jgi:hypothetical protein